VTRSSPRPQQPAVPRKSRCQPAEGDGRDGQVVHQLDAAAERCARLAEHVRQAAGAASTRVTAMQGIDVQQEHVRVNAAGIAAFGEDGEPGAVIVTHRPDSAPRRSARRSPCSSSRGPVAAITCLLLAANRSRLASVHRGAFVRTQRRLCGDIDRFDGPAHCGAS
jgi:hypothetical protein